MLANTVLVAAALSSPGCGFSPCPSWEPTWNITRSTIIMPCNLSGYFDPKIAGQFAVVGTRCCCCLSVLLQH